LILPTIRSEPGPVWVETDFADPRLEVSDDGMNAAPLFRDVPPVPGLLPSVLNVEKASLRTSLHEWCRRA
jgi:hypothetical protein